jgi:glycosyltransferase involved in cell wall biosynthesis
MGYRDRRTILRAVQSVLDQTCSEPFEVVVVTSGDDDSAEAVRRTFPSLPVVASRTRLLPGAARNRGVAATSGRVVAFLAADCLAEPGWVAARLSAHAAGHAAVASAVTNGERRSPAAWGFLFELYFRRLPGRPSGWVAHTDQACHGLSYERALLERLGPFDERLEIGEDTDAARRLSALDVPVWFDREIRTAHLGPTRTVDMVRDRARRGRRAAIRDRVDEKPTGAAMVLLLPGWTRRLAGTLRLSWRDAEQDRWWVVVSAPWIVAARAAGLVGWYAGCGDGRAPHDDRDQRARLAGVPPTMQPQSDPAATGR